MASIQEMASKWNKVKKSIGTKLLCYNVPNPKQPCAYVTDSSSSSSSSTEVGLLSFVSSSLSLSMSRFRVPDTASSQNTTCSICLNKMKPGVGHAIFTAECSHSFHFQCITTNVKHGNQVCPVCRATWKEIPMQEPNCTHDELARPKMMALIPRLPLPPLNSTRHVVVLSQSSEASVFDDDESLGQDSVNVIPTSNAIDNQTKAIDIKTHTEFSSVEQSKSCEDFTVLIHIKAAMIKSLNNSKASRAPIDLVTVLDISGSMAGTKLALLKRAMGFLIQNLNSGDRLSVIAFSSTARRLFPLRRMSETGRQQALLAVNSLVANGGTNIAQGLSKGAKVMDERREKNPIASIILLSDGQDTYTTVNSFDQIIGLNRSNFQIPVHVFGFGADHDASFMHTISEISGGTFSFLETEAAIQDAFAQCIGGLLSVTVQNLQVCIECVHPSIHLQSFKTGNYPTQIMSNQRLGAIDVGDIYADEERDFLVSVNVPAETTGNSQTPLLKVNCSYTDPVTKESSTSESAEVQIKRPKSCTRQQEVGSIEVDRHRNRVLAAEAMSQARGAAELGQLENAISILEKCRKKLSGTVSAKSQDRVCVALDSELKEMKERMGSRHVYETSGRAYVLSGLSSHSWQRATARGDSTERSSLIRPYQTPSMVDMVTRSQASLVTGSSRTVFHPVWSFAPPKPR